jgi:hypothetical protein
LEEVKGQFRWKRWGIGIFSLCILVWMTWYFGYTYIRIVAQSDNSTKAAPNEQEQQLLNLSSLDFWTCQVGVFQSEDNALQEKKRLEELGWEAQIITKSPWSVAIGYAYSQEELASIREHLKEGGIVTVPKYVKITQHSYRIRGASAEQTARILEVVHNYLRTSTSLTTSISSAVSTPSTPSTSALSSPEKAFSQFEKELIVPGPKGLLKLQEVGLYVIKAERTLQEDAKKIIKLRLLAEYQTTLENLQK